MATLSLSCFRCRQLNPRTSTLTLAGTCAPAPIPPLCALTTPPTLLLANVAIGYCSYSRHIITAAISNARLNNITHIISTPLSSRPWYVHVCEVARITGPARAELREVGAGSSSIRSLHILEPSKLTWLVLVSALSLGTSLCLKLVLHAVAWCSSAFAFAS